MLFPTLLEAEYDYKDGSTDSDLKRPTFSSYYEMVPP